MTYIITTAHWQCVDEWYSFWYILWNCYYYIICTIHILVYYCNTYIIISYEFFGFAVKKKKKWWIDEIAVEFNRKYNINVKKKIRNRRTIICWQYVISFYVYEYTRWFDQGLHDMSNLINTCFSGCVYFRVFIFLFNNLIYHRSYFNL